MAPLLFFFPPPPHYPSKYLVTVFPTIARPVHYETERTPSHPQITQSHFHIHFISNSGSVVKVLEFLPLLVQRNGNNWSP